MASEIKQAVKDATKAAMRAKEKERLGVLRVIASEFKKIEVDERIELEDDRVLVVLDKMLKQRRDAAKQYDEAGRDDLAQQEKFEIEIIQNFMPAALSETEIVDIVKAAIGETGASGMADMGKLMGVIKPQVQGRADMGQVSKLVKEALA